MFYRRVDGNTTLVSEVHNVAEQTAKLFQDDSLQVSNSENFLESLYTDEHSNVHCKFPVKKIDGTVDFHDYILNAKVTRSTNLQTLKESMLSLKTTVFENISKHIMEQITNTIVFLFSCFDFDSKHDLDSRLDKVSELWDFYGLDTTHHCPEKWFHFSIIVKYTRKLHCDRETLLSEFRSLWPQFTKLAKRRANAIEQMHNAPKSAKIMIPSQADLVSELYTHIEISLPNVARLLEIMVSISANTGPVERSYSILNNICAPRRGSMTVNHMETYYMNGVLKIPVKKLSDGHSYSDEVAFLTKKE